MNAPAFRRPEERAGRAPAAAPELAPGAPLLDAEAITRDGKAVIRLGEQHYLLRITRQGKLLLTK